MTGPVAVSIFIYVYGKTPKATKERDTIKLLVKLYTKGKLNFFWQGVVK